ncbi:MAG TPA: NADH-quinone oxidoreductase subunit NuoG, partial [Plasticicumulans sp.]|nr:NADH-quinone oxidoreductase subunit NuoG [Plasticicumulans sp.]
MSEDLVNIEVNGTPLQARKGQMLIEVTDAAGITVPRFCYHKKLSIAANCRMCLVEVEKAPKPLPACATPVMDGMKVQTRSPKALAAQKGTMEFLLINHPLDCPICDQGGECELQDVAMGYGGDVSRYVERKRVVKDKDIGPLVATEMTRCIHCTRCVRFGEEIAGLREMGATGRGENTEIGTYVRKSLASELSGNIIDLCPVGALTAKPSRYSARSWEMSQHAGIAGHDGIGSNVWHHVRYGKIVRTVPRENEAVNEVWLSDRDRFSYEGLYSSDRATQPMVRGADGALAITGWEAALEATAAGLKAVIAKHGAAQVGVLVSPSATLEELFLAQKLARGLGIASIDHRLRQIDFTAAAGGYPSLGLALADVPRLDAALVIGSNVRMELPLFAHRLRQASLKGGKIAFLNQVRYAQTLDPAAEFVVSPAAMVGTLARLAAAVAGVKGVNVPAALAAAGEPSEAERGYAETLAGAGRAAIFLGQLALSHPQYAQLQAIAGFLARSCGATVGYLAPGANAAGASLAGALPAEGGQDAQAMLAAGLKGYVLIGIEPEFDCAAPAVAARALAGAEFVVALGTHLGGTVEREADVVLPVAACVETSGT